MRFEDLTLSEVSLLMKREELHFTYKNYKGDINDRSIRPVRLKFGYSQYHPSEEPEYFLVGFDKDKQALREFLVSDILDVVVSLV